MTGLTTGGFSVTDDSIATYGSPLVETVLLPIMVAGATAFPVHYAVFKEGRIRALVDDLQTRWLFIVLGVGVLVLSLQNVLVLTNAFGPAWFSLPGLSGAQVDAIRDSAFQFISALTCTGFQSAPIGGWADGGKLLLSGAMTLGGAAGSTVGGIKVIRGYTLISGIRWQFERVFLPANAVVSRRIGDRVLDRETMTQEFAEAAIVDALWVLLLAVGVLVLVNLTPLATGVADARFEVASAQGNVGLSAGITGPGMRDLGKAMFVLNMWIGRLEIIPVLVFLRAGLYGFDP